MSKPLPPHVTVFYVGPEEEDEFGGQTGLDIAPAPFGLCQDPAMFVKDHHELLATAVAQARELGELLVEVLEDPDATIEDVRQYTNDIYELRGLKAAQALAQKEKQ